MTNRGIAEIFGHVADLLEEQVADPFRVRAWRAGAQAVRDHPVEMSEVFRDHGRSGLEAIPHLGAHLSAVIVEVLRTGRCAALDRLRGDTSPADRFARLPGIGPALAERIHRVLGIGTLEELEVAAHDGSLAAVPGLGARRVAAIRDLLATRLARRGPRSLEGPRDLPPVALLLDIDRLYRARADAGVLRRIAPRRFNPTGAAWLPVQHEARDGWAFTALYSNSALAHEIGKTHDWVVLYYHHPDQAEHQATVVTETSGPLQGRRVVRGRERECAAHHAQPARGHADGAPAPAGAARRG